VSSELEIIDGEVAARVGEGDQASGFTRRPFVPPQIGSTVWSCEDAAHPFARGIVGAGPSRVVGDDLPNVRGACGEGGKQHPPVVKLVVHGAGEGDAVARAFEGHVKARKKAEPAGKHRRDAAQVPAEDLPFEEGAPAGGARDRVEESTNLVVALGREGDEATDRVNDPTQELFLRCPVGVAKPKLFNRVRRLPMTIVSIIGAEEEVEAMEHVPACLAELGGCALSESQEVVDEDVNVGQGGSRRAIGWPVRCWVRRTGELLQRMGRCEVGQSPGVVDQVGRSLGGGAEERGRFDESHRQREVKADDGFRVTRMRWHDEGQFGKVGQVEPDAHVGIGQVDFGHVDRSVEGVGVHDGVEKAVKCAPKLHGFGRCLLAHGPVGAAPGVVINQPIATTGLGYATDWAESKVGQVPSLAPGQEEDMPEGDLFGEFLADVGGGESCGAVAAVCEGGLQVLGRGVRREEHGSAPGSKLVVELGRGVRTRRKRSQFVSPAGRPAHLRK
jgi:hypothetical protein